MAANEVITGYLDVKISAKSRRGLTPWKAWQRQYCEIRRLDDIQNGAELKLKSHPDGGNVLNCVIIPRSATICRTESRTKQYAFGVFTLGRRSKKPILFLAGNSESDSQEWMSSIRRMLSIASYLPVGESNFRISLVDNAHSKNAGIIGLYGVLSVNSQEIVISDPFTGDPKITWQWYQFHQFHLQVPAQPTDDKVVVVMHTSGDFPSGPGQLYMYCKQGPRLLRHLIARGKRPRTSNSLLTANKRLSRSEGDLVYPLMQNNSHLCTPDSPLCFRSQTGSDDSGVRVSIASDDYNPPIGGSKNKTAASSVSLEMALLMKTPGGSESNDSVQDLTVSDEPMKGNLPRRESGVSLASGIYEEIPDDHISGSKCKKTEHHVYENPLDLILNSSKTNFKPPPLPPRIFDRFSSSKLVDKYDLKQRCNTLPAKDLSRISQIFTSDSDYVVMSPAKSNVAEKSFRKPSLTESLYMPMSPVINLKNKIVESCYMSMNGRKN